MDDGTACYREKIEKENERHWTLANIVAFSVLSSQQFFSMDKLMTPTDFFRPSMTLLQEEQKNVCCRWRENEEWSSTSTCTDVVAFLEPSRFSSIDSIAVVRRNMPILSVRDNLLTQASCFFDYRFCLTRDWMMSQTTWEWVPWTKKDPVFDTIFLLSLWREMIFFSSSDCLHRWRCSHCWNWSDDKDQSSLFTSVMFLRRSSPHIDLHYHHFSGTSW